MGVVEECHSHCGRFEGWRERLLGCLALQLSHSEPCDYRSSLLLSLISRLSLNPSKDSSGHLRLIAKSLYSFLSSVDFKKSLSLIHPDPVLRSLSELECASCVSYREEYSDSEEEDEPELPRRQRSVFVSQYFLHEDSDGLPLIFKDQAPTASGDCYDLDDVTLYILHDMFISDVPETHSLLESIAYSISVVSRIATRTNENHPSVIQNFLSCDPPDVSNMHEYRNWSVISSLLLRSSRSAVEAEMRSGIQPDSLPPCIQLAIQCPRHFLRSVKCSIEINGVNETEFSGGSDFILAFEEAFRMLTMVVDVALLILRLPLVDDKGLSFCLDAISMSDEQAFVETIQDTFALAESFGVDQLESRNNFLRSIVQLADQLEKSKAKNCSTKRDQSLTNKERSVKSCPEMASGECALAFLHRLMSAVIADASSRVAVEGIFDFVKRMPPGFCSCISPLAVISSLAIESALSLSLDCFLDALTIHLPNRFPRPSATLSTNIIGFLSKCIASLEFTSAEFLMRLLTLIFPHLALYDAEAILESLIIRYCELSGDDNGKVHHSDSEMLCGLIAEFLAEYIFGVKALSLATERILIPFLRQDDHSPETFSSFCAFFRTVLLSAAPFSLFKEALCSALLMRFERDLGLARSDIWTLISASEFSLPLLFVVDLLWVLIAHNDLKGLPELQVKRLRHCCGIFVDVCLDWLHSPSDLFSLIHRTAQLLATSLAIILSTEPSNKMQLTERFRSDLLQTLPEKVSFRVAKCVINELLNCSTSPPTGLRSHEDIGKKQHVRELLHPEMCLISLKLLSDLLQKHSKLAEYDESCVKEFCSKLETICLASKINMNALLATKMVPASLALAETLISTSVSVDCFTVVLGLYSGLVMTNPQPSDLKALFMLIRKAPHLQLAVMDTVLDLLHANPVEPTECLVFPQKALPELPSDTAENNTSWSAVSPSDSFEHVHGVLSSSLSQSSTFFSALERILSPLVIDDSKKSPEEADIAKIATPSETAETRSIATLEDLCAAELCLGKPLNVFLCDGIGISFWLRVDRSSAHSEHEPRMLPVCSVGSPEYLFSLRIGNDGESLYVVNQLRDRCLYRKRLRHPISLSQWVHITLSLVIIDGVFSLNVSMDGRQFNYAAESRCPTDAALTPLVVGFGALERPAEHSPIFYEISSIFAFRGQLSEQCSLVLRSLGCDLCSLAETSSSSISGCFPPLITVSAALSPAFSLSSLLKDPKRIINRLQRSFLFVIRSSSAHSFGASVLHPGVDTQFLIEGGGSLLELTMLKDYPVYWRCRIAQRQILSPEHSLLPLGSTRLLLFLLAQSVDMRTECKVQATALRLVMSFIRRSASSTAEFLSARGFTVIARCFSSPLADIGQQTVNEILRASVSELNLLGNDCMKPTHSSVIVDPELLTSLICCADIWRGRERVFYWSRLLQSVSFCLSDVTARCFTFNRSQLERTHFLYSLFHTFHVILQDEKNFLVSQEESKHLVKALVTIISALLGCPEKSETVTFLWHFIFLSHPAVHTYLNYQVRGHTDWLKSDLLKDDRVDQSPFMEKLADQSQLAAILQDYVRVLGKECISEVWARERSVLTLRRMYETAKEEARTSRSSSMSSDSVQLTSNTQPCFTLPDLVSGIDEIADNRISLSEESDDHRLPPPADETDCCDVEWIGILRSGVIELLSVVIQNGPDALIHALVHDAIGWQSIIVLLSNQEDILFRDSVFLLLEHFLLRSPSRVREAFVKHCGFAILGNQLRGYPVTSKVADTLFALLCGESVRLNEGLDSGHIQSVFVDQFSCSSFDAIFAMWEESVNLSDLSIFWNVSSALLKIFETNSLLMQAMMDSQLCDTLVSVLRRIACLPAEPIDIENSSALSPFIECWGLLAKRVIISCVPYNDTRHYEMCQRLIHLMQFALLNFTFAGDSDAEAVVRHELCSLLLCWMSSLQSVYTSEGLSASAAPSAESLSRSPTPTSATAEESQEDGDEDGYISSSLASSLHGTSPMAALITGSFANLREKITSLGSQMKCRYKWRHRVHLPSPSEITKRALFCLNAMVQLFTVIQPTSSAIVSEQEETVLQFLICFLFSTWKREQYANFQLGKGSKGKSSSRPNAWSRLLASCRDRARFLLGQLIAFVLFPAEEKISALSGASHHSPQDHKWHMKKRLMILRSLANDLPYKNILKTLLDINLDYQYAMNLALHELALVEKLNDVDAERDIEKLIKFLRHLQIESPLANLSPERLDSLSKDEMLSLHAYVEHRNTFFLSMRQKAAALFDDEHVYTEHISQLAMSVTCEVVDEQNIPRKAFIKACRDAEVDVAYAEEIISDLAVQLCHPEAVCHDPASWPLSWELDPTEGPNRERRRLTPAHLKFDRKFVLPEHSAKLENRDRLLPLSDLLSGRRTSSKEWSMMENLAAGERIKVSMPATVVRSTLQSQGEILIGDKKFYFFGDATRSTQKGISHETAMIVAWEYSSVVEIYKRHNLLKDLALEIFFSDGQTYLIVFEDQQKRDYFMSSLLAMDLSNLMNSPQNLQSVTQMWREGKMTNFEYLMQLNKLAGRSFNDLMQYPVFPFILSNYCSSVIDLSDSTSYRNLAKPMAVQDKRMEEHYLRNYACLETEVKRTVQSANAPIIFGPYHYGSHYSNSGIVVHYLVRLPPFTDIALEYQDNSFDIPDRLFNSIETTWRLSSYESTTDFKELIPEFFYLPEFLINREGLNLGMRQNGDIVNDVALPKWCAGSARIFILIQRQALESSIVTAHLHLWIDLIFGYKQTGQPAIQAINVFHPATYRGGILEDESAEHDPLSLSALQAMVRTYGQMPTQLFLSPHLPHLASRGFHWPAQKFSPSPLDSVIAARWGEFVGSPDSEYGCPVVVLKQRARREAGHISHLIAAPDGSCFAFRDKTLFIFRHKNNIRPKDFTCSALLSWYFTDTVLRFRLLNIPSVLWSNLIDLQSFTVTAIEYSPSSGLLFLALSSAVTRVYRISFGQSGLHECVHLRDLFAHDKPVCTLSVCGEYAVAVSGCTEGKVCVWDTNKLSFVRTLVNHFGNAAKLSCISTVSCDVAVVFQSGYGSRVCLYTVNGEEVGHVETDITVTSIGMTSLFEGTAINCLALGMQNGIVRLLDMWTLAPVRDIFDYNFLEPIVSLTFANRCTRLFVCLASGLVLCWQGENLQTKRPPSLNIITAGS